MLIKVLAAECFSAATVPFQEADWHRYQRQKTNPIVPCLPLSLAKCIQVPMANVALVEGWFLSKRKGLGEYSHFNKQQHYTDGYRQAITSGTNVKCFCPP